MVLRNLLLPIARFCVGRSIRLQELTDAMKRCLVEAAREQLVREGERPTGARLSVLTGVHRKDLKSFEADTIGEPLRKHPIVRLLSLWTTDREFSDSTGRPKVLSIGASGPGSFAALAERLGGDASQYGLLFVLERDGFIERGKDGTVTLVKTEYTNRGAGWEMLSELFEDGIRCIEHNLVAPPEQLNLQLKTVFDNIPQRFAEKLRAEIRDRGVRFQEEIRVLLSQYDRDVNPKMHEFDDPPVELSCSVMGVVVERKTEEI
jgi:hypothetical protein